MTLTASGSATGRRCPVCGSPDGACGGTGHAQNEPVPVDAALYTKGTRMAAPDVVVRRIINGVETQVLASSEQAEAEGWEVVRRMDGKPYHKKRPAPEPVKPEAPATVEPEPADEPEPDPAEDRRAELETKTKPDLYELAQDLDVAGRSTMDRGELITAILATEIRDAAGDGR